MMTAVAVEEGLAMHGSRRETLGAALLLVTAIALLMWNPLVEIAGDYNREVFVSGGLIYGSLRGVVSAMSIVRDADIQASVGVAAISGSPGQALQPVIATIERMANLLFALTLASGVLATTLPAVAGLGALVLAVGSGGLVILGLFGRGSPHALRQGAAACTRLGLLAAIIVPSAYALAFYVGDEMTADAWRSAAAIFDRQSAELEGTIVIDPLQAPGETPAAPLPGEQASDSGLFGWIGGLLSGAVQGSADAIQGAVNATAGFAGAVRDQVAANARVVTDGLAAAGQLFDASVAIGVAYLVKLVVLPVLILFGFVWVLRAIRAPQPVRIETIERPVTPALSDAGSDGDAPRR
jgi:hypothetical protein